MRKKQTLIVVFAAGILLVFAFLYVYVPWESHQTSGPIRVTTRTIHLDGRALSVEVAETPEAQEVGLGGRSGLAEDTGMLFVFSRDDQYGFWMKDMRFPIDILWFSRAGEAVYIARSVSPDTYPTVFKPFSAARYVLELPAGYSQQYNVRPGSRLDF